LDAVLNEAELQLALVGNSHPWQLAELPFYTLDVSATRRSGRTVFNKDEVEMATIKPLPLAVLDRTEARCWRAACQAPIVRVGLAMSSRVP
jgi:hypothetical protein